MKNFNIKSMLLTFLAGACLFISCQEDEESFPETRMFRPVLNTDLYAEGSTIIVDLAKNIKAKSYKIEISRDTFQTIEYTVEVETNFVEINAALTGEELFWNTLYQVRAYAQHIDDPAFDSNVADLGNVRTQRFPTILNLPEDYDVTDIAARLTWAREGLPVTGVKVFASTDLRLENPLIELDVNADEEQAGVKIIEGLSKETTYQMAIYSTESVTGAIVIRGWVDYTTRMPDIDYTAGNIIDVREDESPQAVANAIDAAVSGSIILVKRGVTYDLPSSSLNKSITIRSAYGLGPQKAKLFSTGGWNLEDGVDIDRIEFHDIEIEGEDIGGDYVFNVNRSLPTTVNELVFDNCIIHNVRGVLRIRGGVSINNYTITNSVVYDVGGYAVFAQGTNAGDGIGSFGNVLLENSTFYSIDRFCDSRTDILSYTIDGCTIFNAPKIGDSFIYFRGGSNALNGVTISNTIIGHAKDVAGDATDFSFKGIDGDFETTVFSVVNSWGTADVTFSEGSEIPSFPSLPYEDTSEDLWVSPENGDFNFKDSNFAGRFDAGDPRWRVVL